jgi:hypothetical protein
VAILNANSQPLLYDPRIHPTFESWADLMCELYAGNALEIPNSQTDWRAWASGLLAIDIFTNQAVPMPDAYENWYDWVNATIGTINAGGNA